VISAEAADPITALLTRDWAALGGWSLFIGLALFILYGLISERIVPGARYKRLEESAIKTQDALSEAMKQNGQLVTSNEITKHFFEETTPKRGST
jgi:hypothetical protein